MHLLVAGRSGLEPMTLLELPQLYAAYASPVSLSTPWLRCNMVTSLDGAATGSDGRSGSINNPADHIVFESLRALSHAVVVGAGTVRTEGYPPLAVAPSLLGLRRRHGLPDPLPLVVVSNRGEVPDPLRGVRDGSVLLALPGRAAGRKRATDDLGSENVLVCGVDTVDLPGLLTTLHARGLTQLLTEGGPTLLGSLLAAGLLDELCYTIVPHVVGGGPPRTVGPTGVAAELELGLLLEQDGTLLGRWFVSR